MELSIEEIKILLFAILDKNDTITVHIKRIENGLKAESVESHSIETVRAHKEFLKGQIQENKALFNKLSNRLSTLQGN